MMTINQLIENLNKIKEIIKKEPKGNFGVEKFNICNENFTRGTHSKLRRWKNQ